MLSSGTVCSSACRTKSEREQHLATSQIERLALYNNYTRVGSYLAGNYYCSGNYCCRQLLLENLAQLVVCKQLLF